LNPQPGVIIDAGPVLDFLARKDWTRILYSALPAGSFSVPATVEKEVLRKAHVDRRFATVTNQWTKLKNADRVRVLPDEVTAELNVVVQDICGLSMPKRLGTPKDLGETMAIAHAVVLAEQGHDVAIVIQERDGSKAALREQARLMRLGLPQGSLTVWSVADVLAFAVAAHCPTIPDQTSVIRIWREMRAYDDALPEISETRLLDQDLWES
jgi:hypothetical protein